MERSSVTPTPQQLKALTHPVRLRLLGLLRAEGPATATLLATRLGLNSGATSYHLRQLAEHGFIEEDNDRGNARDRWWRAAHRSTYTDAAEPGDLETRETLEAYLQAVVTVHTDRLQRAVEQLSSLPHEWWLATTFSDWSLRLTPARAKALVEAIEQVLESTEPGDDEGAADFVVQLSAFPRPGQVGGEP